MTYAEAGRLTEVTQGKPVAMDDYRLYAVEAQAVEDMAMLHEQAALLHDRAAQIQDEQTRQMTTKGEARMAALSVERAERARDLAAVERARADQVRARHGEMTARLNLLDHP